MVIFHSYVSLPEGTPWVLCAVALYCLLVSFCFCKTIGQRGQQTASLRTVRRPRTSSTVATSPKMPLDGMQLDSPSPPSSCEPWWPPESSSWWLTVNKPFIRSQPIKTHIMLRPCDFGVLRCSRLGKTPCLCQVSCYHFFRERWPGYPKTLCPSSSDDLLLHVAPSLTKIIPPVASRRVSACHLVSAKVFLDICRQMRKKSLAKAPVVVIPREANSYSAQGCFNCLKSVRK